MTEEPKLELDHEIGVLVCDDNAEIRSILTEIIVLEPGLRFLGHACDGNEAIVKARLLQPDIIILDLAMPNRSGLDALPELAVEGKLRGFRHSGVWLTVTTPKDIRRAEDDMTEHPEWRPPRRSA